MSSEESEGRRLVRNEDQAREDLGLDSTRPHWLERDVTLPFDSLSPDEFEVFCFILLLREEAPDTDEVYYYGKTGDAGRDIIRVLTDGRLELIQCKHTSSNIGISVVKKELAKVFVNVFEGKIPGRRPDLVTFYVSSGLTSQALDLVRNQILWNSCAATEISKFLGSPPSRRLLRFSREWWPCHPPQIGLTLAERAKEIGGLVDEFFTVRKVVDASALAPLDEKLNQLIEEQMKDVPERMTSYVRQIEEWNPDFHVAVESSAKNTKYTIRPKQGVGKVEIAKIEFPASEDGRRGYKKFERYLDEGHAVELTASEAKWEFGLHIPQLKAVEPESRIRITKNISKNHLPVRVECWRDEELVASIPFSKVRLERLGRKEREWVVSSGGIAGSMRFVLRSSPVHEGKLHFDFQPEQASARVALTTADFMRNVDKGARIEVINLENEETVVSVWGAVADVDTQVWENTQRFLAYLCVINDALGIDLRYPEKVTTDDAIGAEFLALAIRHGRFARRTPGLIYDLDASGDDLKNAVEGWSSGTDVTYSFESSLKPIICGQTLPVINYLMELGPLVPEEPIEKVLEAARCADAEGLKGIGVVCENVVYTFPDWHRVETSGDKDEG